jgi:hypothetical protein
MALVLRSAQSGGGCCPCSQQQDPCTCGGGCVLECRRCCAGDELCGFTEFVGGGNGSRWLAKGLAGSVTGRVWQLANCTGESEGQSFVYSGRCRYDPDTCGIVESSFTVQETTGDTTIVTTRGCGFIPGTDSGRFTVETTPTKVTGTGTGACVSGTVRNGQVSVELSDANTVETSFARKCGSPETWEVTPITVFPSCITREIVTETDPKVYSKCAAQVRARVPQSVAKSWHVIIRLGERPINTGGPFISFGRTIEFDLETDSDPETPNWSDWFDVDTEEGLEIAVIGCTSEEIPS